MKTTNKKSLRERIEEILNPLPPELQKEAIRQLMKELPAITRRANMRLVAGGKKDRQEG